ncbi:ROK family transcriptional regulator [Streptomyces apocyni]|uniref:ROK family transcriptional regulator n=1 Tax=Streptomyces apocyni TaxID=2654677 RepID=UPI0012EA01E9|nr:ROK family transcriptional regulator [Streptomyces apocyni]
MPPIPPIRQGSELPHTQQGIRRRNLSLVLRTVAAQGPLSRAAVASRIGLTRAAVSTLVDELVRTDLLVEPGPGQRSTAVDRPGRPGRPGSALALSERGPVGIGAEVGVDHLAACAVDLNGTVRAKAVLAGDNRGRPPEPVIKELTRLIREVTEAARTAGLRPAGLGVAVPGLVGRDARTVVRAPNLGWTQVDLGQHLGDALPPYVDNEANLGALAELWLGGSPTRPTPDSEPASESAAGGAIDAAADGTTDAAAGGDLAPRDFLHVSAEIGIGAAVVVDGRLLRGARGFAGELGHVPVRPEGPDCPCGGRGCLEQYAGAEAVLRAAGLPPGEGRVGQLAALADGGDPRVRRALRGAGSALGIAVSGAVNLLDPQTVVLGGALSRLAPWLLPAMERELRRRTADPERPSGASVSVSRLGSDGPLLGAAHAVVQAVLDDPASAPPPPA